MLEIITARDQLTTARFATENTSLFLDLDGTLADFARRPSDVTPVARRTELLRRLFTRLSGRLAIISGRSLADVDRITEGVVRCVAGSHGLERRNAAGDITSLPAHPELDRVLARAHEFVECRPGLMIERKSASFALHFRGAPELERTVNKFAEGLAAETGLSLIKGVNVVELKTPGPNKGDAVRAFVAEMPFIGATPIFVGDDITDEDAFGAVAQMGGLGVLVGEARDTLAQARLDDPGAVLDWLEGAVNSGIFAIARIT